MSSSGNESSAAAKTREESRSETRAALICSAELQFLSKGYRRAGLDEIAESAGYSKGAIYSNFSSKQELFLAVSHERSERKAQPLLEALALSGSAEEKLGAFEGWLRSISPADNEWILVEIEFRLIERWSPDIAATLQAGYRRARSDVTAVITDQLEALGITPTVEVAAIAETMIALESGLALSHAVDPTVSSNHLIDVFGALIGFPASSD